jgi:hypothetical protein
MVNYFFSGGDIFVNSETFLMTDFVNLNIKPAQIVYKDMMCIRVFIGVSAHTYINIVLCF